MSDDYILETRNLTKDFLGFVAVDGVSLRVRRGTIHALIGPNGAGKTTCFNLLTRFLSPTSGTILYRGQDITAERPARVARMGMVRSFQISATFPHLTVLENVRVALQRKLAGSFRFWQSEKTLRVLGERALEVLASVGLDRFAGLLTIELPYGRKRALEIATTMALEPALMLLDEPTSGLGHEDVGLITGLIRKVAADRTVLMVEHNLGIVSQLSDTLTVMARGRVLAEGPYAEVSRNPEVRTAYLGTAHAAAS